MELRAFVAIVRARGRVIAASAIIAGLAALLVSLLLPPTYEASAKVIVGPAMQSSVRDVNQLQAASQLAQTYAQALQTKATAGAVIDQLGLSATPDDLLKNVTVDVARDAPIITITASAATANGAADLANAMAQRLLGQTSAAGQTDVELQKTIQDQITLVRSQIDAANAQIAVLEANAKRTPAEEATLATLRQSVIQQQSTLASLLTASLGSSYNTVAILDPAVPPTDKASPKTLLNVVLAVLIGGLLGMALAFGLSAVDDSLKTNEDVEEALHTGVVGAVGRLPRGPRERPGSLVMLDDPRSSAAEAFRTMRTNIEFADADQPIRSLLVASPDDGDGRSTVAANLALAFAQAGKSTILVDADLRRPTLHQIFGTRNGPGLGSLLRVDQPELGAFLSPTTEPNLRLLSSGGPPPNPADLLGSERMRNLIPRLTDRADVVVFDSSPLGSVGDAAEVAAVVDATVLVVVEGRTSRGGAQSAADAVGRVHGRLLGAVLNRPPGPRLGRGRAIDPNRASAGSMADQPPATRPTA